MLQWALPCECNLSHCTKHHGALNPGAGFHSTGQRGWPQLWWQKLTESQPRVLKDWHSSFWWVLWKVCKWWIRNNKLNLSMVNEYGITALYIEIIGRWLMDSHRRFSFTESLLHVEWISVEWMLWCRFCSGCLWKFSLNKTGSLHSTGRMISIHRVNKLYIYYIILSISISFEDTTSVREKSQGTAMEVMVERDETLRLVVR